MGLPDDPVILLLDIYQRKDGSCPRRHSCRNLYRQLMRTDRNPEMTQTDSGMDD